MKKCIMYDGVETIELEAFHKCTSLDALSLPPSIKKIDGCAFWECTNIRILSIPASIDISKLGESIGKTIIHYCDTFFQITHIPQYDFSPYLSNNARVNQALIDFYRNAPPLYRACLDVNVSDQTIHDCIVTHGTQAASVTDYDGMTPLHILAVNPHATLGSIEECFDADTSAALLEDNRGNTPLDYLKENNLDGHTWLVTSLCMYRDSEMR